MSHTIRYHKLHIQAPECTIYVALGLVQLKALATRIAIPDELIEDVESEFCDGAFGNTVDGQHLFIYLPEEYNPIITAHECIHAAGSIWEWVGARLAHTNDEVLTYTHDAIHTMIKELYNGD
jgi:hypothetical protein